MPKFTLSNRRVAPLVRAAAFKHQDDHHPVYSSSIEKLTDEALDGYVEELLADSREHRPRPPGLVPSTHLWWVEHDRSITTYLGRVHIRHRLTTALRETGGHIGYYVVPPARQRGHATAMLAAALPVAAELGIDCALITCDETNAAFRRVIEHAGGLLQDRRGDKLRYWVPTS